MTSKILVGMREAVSFARGEPVNVRQTVMQVPKDVDVRAIRKRLGLTQEEFSNRFGFTRGSVRNWEQGHRKPQGPARILLTIIAREPEAVNRALSALGNSQESFQHT